MQPIGHYRKRPPMRIPWTMLVPVMILFICLSPAAFVRSKIEQSIEAKAPSLLGPAKSYNVSVTGGLLGIIRGQLEEIDIRGNDVRLSNGVVVDRLDVILKGVRFTRDQTVTDVHRTSFAASLSEHNLEDYLRRSRSDMADADVSLGNGKVSIAAKPRIMLIKTPVRVEGEIQIVQATKLYVILSSLSARGVRVPGIVRGHIQHNLNPVLDTAQMGMGMKLSKVAIRKGAILLTGTADVKRALAAK